MLYANAAHTEAINSAAAFLVVVRRDTGYGVSPVDLRRDRRYRLRQQRG